MAGLAGAAPQQGQAVPLEQGLRGGILEGSHSLLGQLVCCGPLEDGQVVQQAVHLRQVRLARQDELPPALHSPPAAMHPLSQPARESSQQVAAAGPWQAAAGEANAYLVGESELHLLGRLAHLTW